MLRLFANAKYDFIGIRRTTYVVSAVFLAIGLGALLLRGVNYSVEFTGGTLVQIETREPLNTAQVRTALAERGLANAEIIAFGSPRDWVIRARTAVAGADADNTEVTGRAIGEALDTLLGAEGYQMMRTEAIGPKVGGELRQKALMAILLSFVAVLAYLAYRFEWRFGLAAVIATGHDLLTTIGYIGLLKMEISLVVVAAVLSMVGYSLNDTIIIFDRVRENLRKLKNVGFVEVLNRSINETLPRGVLTHGTTLAALLALGIFGGEVIRPFALVMIFGVITGTFSSMFIASPVLLAIEQRWPGAGVKALRVPGKPSPPASPSGRKPQPVGR